MSAIPWRFTKMAIPSPSAGISIRCSAEPAMPSKPRQRCSPIFSQRGQRGSFMPLWRTTTRPPSGYARNWECTGKDCSRNSYRSRKTTAAFPFTGTRFSSHPAEGMEPGGEVNALLNPRLPASHRSAKAAIPGRLPKPLNIDQALSHCLRKTLHPAVFLKNITRRRPHPSARNRHRQR